MPFVAKENPKVTPERVVKVCEALGAEHVTLRAVQAQVGGSMRDVAPIVKHWRKTHPTPGIVVPAATELAAQISARLVAADVGETSVRIERWQRTQEQESQHWRAEVHSLRATIDGLRRHITAAADQPTAATNVVSLGERAAPAELNKTLRALNERLDKLEHDLAERDAKLPSALQETLTAVSRNAEASAEKIVQVLTDLPQTLRQAPVSQVDKAINQRLESTAFELTHRAAELAARPDRTDDVIAAVDRLNAAAARRQTKQARLATTAQDALLARVDALVSALTFRKRNPKRKTASTRKRVVGAKRATKALKRKSNAKSPASRRRAVKSKTDSRKSRPPLGKPKMTSSKSKSKGSRRGRKHIRR